MNKSKKIICAAAGIIPFVLFPLTACLSRNDSGGTAARKTTGNSSGAEITLEKNELTLTIGESEKLNYFISSDSALLVWSSSAPLVASVSSDGIVTALAFTSGGTSRFTSSPATGTAVITVKTADGGAGASVTVTTTTAARTDMMSLPPLKDQFSNYFMLGNIFNPRDVASNGSSVTNEQLTHHYNVLTHENDMKPRYLAPDRNGRTIQFNFTTADRMINAALASGFKVHGHTLLWHNQIPNWQQDIADAGRDTALAAMRDYISGVVRHFAGRVYSWDVLNEAFPDNAGSGADWKNAIRSGARGEGQGANPWYAAIGSDFVYEGYLAARLADPSAILYYNDYNTDNSNRARLIRDMVRDVNARYKEAYPNEKRLLIEGIGMQEHHNTGVSAARVKDAIDMFRPLGVILSVSELDVLGQSWNAFSSGTGSGTQKDDISTVTNIGLFDQARLYAEYFRVYLDNADIIERVSMWGVTDDRSWRSGGLPLLFDYDGRAKPAYYRVISTLRK